jgi:hypothetical protein
MPERGAVLLQRAEALYAQGKSEETFELYQRAIKKILKDEDVAALLPAIVPNDTPKETLGFLWRNFAGFFKDPIMKFATGMPTFVARVLTQAVAFQRNGRLMPIVFLIPSASLRKKNINSSSPLVLKSC